MTLSELQGHPPIASLISWDFLYSCAAVDRISICIARQSAIAELLVYRLTIAALLTFFASHTTKILNSVRSRGHNYVLPHTESTLFKNSFLNRCLFLTFTFSCFNTLCVFHIYCVNSQIFMFLYLFLCYACDRHAVNKGQLTYLIRRSISRTSLCKQNVMLVLVMHGIPVSEKCRGIKSDGIIYRGLAKYRPQQSTQITACRRD